MKKAAETTPQGFFTYADSYLRSAKLLSASSKSWAHSRAPIRMLAFHAVELYLKAFLCCAGFLSDKLAAEPYRHKLGKLLSEAMDQGLHVASDDAELLNDARLYASAMQSRYLAPSAPDKLLVDAGLLCAVAERFRSALLAHPLRQGCSVYQGERAARG